ncbi:MAG: undecaprenyl-diphosphate phosphatase [Deltaproteobacteria bacterium]|jgi:undecaprenyl-diphosphatase|nr:undecaprenyl-diphosphate phosphatase [Deltaproteobacteria bacterium]
MYELFSAAILGIVEGLTEFIPVSSTGHLILTSYFLGLEGGVISTFEVFIQLGAILAVVVLYRQRFAGLIPGRARPSATAGAPRAAGGGCRGWRGLGLLFLTCLPASLLGLFAHAHIKQYLFNPYTVTVALAVGAVCMLLLERFKKAPRVESVDQITPALALGIGVFQCLALWPGFSRSASTIMGGMLLGAGRKTAAEYSFIAAVPIMFAATGFDLLKNFGGIGVEHLPFFAVGFAVSFLSALLAIKFFISVLGRVGLAPFAWYRLALAPLLFLFLIR